MKGAMQCLYCLIMSEIPHTSVDAVLFVGYDYFKNLKMRSTKVRGLLVNSFQVMASQIERKQSQDLLSATFYSIMIDETTDISILN